MKINNMQQEYNKAIEIIERIEEKLDMMEKRLDEVIDKINNKSREAKQQSYIHVNEENK